MRGLNSRHPPCKGGALPTELTARSYAALLLRENGFEVKRRSQRSQWIDGRSRRGSMGVSSTCYPRRHDQRTVRPHPQRHRNRVGFRLHLHAGVLLASGQAVLGGVHRVRGQPAEHRAVVAEGRPADVRHVPRRGRRPHTARAVRTGPVRHARGVVRLRVPDDVATSTSFRASSRWSSS